MAEEVQEGAAEERGFKVGAVVGDTFKVLFRNLLPFGAMTLILCIVPILVAVFLSAMPEWVDSGPLEELWYVVIAVAAFLPGYFILQAMVTYGTYQDLRGRRAGFFACILRGLALILPVVGAALLVTLLSVLGYVALIVPGIITTVILYVVIPVVVVERPGVVAALKRSHELTKGCLGSIFGVMIVLGVVDRIISRGVDLIAAQMGTIAGLILVLIGVGIGFLFLSIAPAVAYYHLRRAKEGVEIEQIAAVFD